MAKVETKRFAHRECDGEFRIRDKGYIYLDIRDRREGIRDDVGHIQPDVKFLEMAGNREAANLPVSPALIESTLSRFPLRTLSRPPSGRSDR